MNRKYEGAVATNELTKKKADVGLAKTLHGLRPGYARCTVTFYLTWRHISAVKEAKLNLACFFGSI